MSNGSTPELLSEAEAYGEVCVMREVLECPDNAYPARYSAVSQRIGRIKGILDELSDESLLGLHGNAHALGTAESEPNEAMHAYELLEDDLRALPYLDAERTIRICELALADSGIAENTRHIVPYIATFDRGNRRSELATLARRFPGRRRNAVRRPACGQRCARRGSSISRPSI
jgi:hypothetical protein